jgi:hypothetical protein
MDLVTLIALIDQLERESPPSRMQIQALHAARKIDFFKMNEQEISERLAAPKPKSLEFLTKPNAQEILKAVKNDLGWHVQVVSHQVSDLLVFGESIAPWYSNRIGVILRRLKRKDLSDRFEAAIAPFLNFL